MNWLVAGWKPKLRSNRCILFARVIINSTWPNKAATCNAPAQKLKRKQFPKHSSIYEWSKPPAPPPPCWTFSRRSRVNGFQPWFRLRRGAGASVILRLLHVRECVAPGSFSVRVAACDCACVCVCALYAVGISSASAAQLNLSQRWVLMSFSSVGVARLARLDVHFCDRFSLSQPNERLATDLNDSFASVLPVRFRYRFNVCRYCAYGYYCQSGQT